MTYALSALMLTLRAARLWRDLALCTAEKRRLLLTRTEKQLRTPAAACAAVKMLHDHSRSLDNLNGSALEEPEAQVRLQGDCKAGTFARASAYIVGSPIMPSADAQGATAKRSAAAFYPKRAEHASPQPRPPRVKVSGFDAVKPESQRGRERFIPVTRFALLDRLTAAERLARRRRHRRRAASSAISITGAASSTTPQLHGLEETYEPFSPDSDLLMTRAFTPNERRVMQKRVVEGMARILEQANYVRIDPERRRADPDARIRTTASTCTSISTPSRRC